jgi:hypothetical protein
MWLHRLGRTTVWARALLLFVLFAAFLLAACPLAWWLYGARGLASAVLATSICLASAWLALFATTVLAPPSRPAAHVLVGMVTRMGLPLLVCLFVTQRQPLLQAAGFSWFLIAAFVLGLALETLMSVGQTGPTT